MLLLLSVLLSGAVAFGVARYTVDHDDTVRHRLAAQQRLSEAYLPLRSTLAAVIACVAPNLCSEAELLQASRAANKAVVAALGQGSATVDDLSTALGSTLRTVVSDRIAGKRPNSTLLGLAGRQFVALEAQISRELDG